MPAARMAAEESLLCCSSPGSLNDSPTVKYFPKVSAPASIVAQIFQLTLLITKKFSIAHVSEQLESLHLVDTLLYLEIEAKKVQSLRILRTP